MKVVHTLEAFDTASHVKNPLHNDEAARKLGYRSSLIAGVDMYGYLTYAAVRRWGMRWLTQGQAKCDLLKPVHKGDICDVVVPDTEGDEVSAELRVGDQVCARALFSIARAEATPSPTAFPWQAQYPSRPVASPESLAVGTVIPTITTSLGKPEASRFLLDERDDLEIYTREQVLHPGYLLRFGNFVLSKNFILGPWIHTASIVRNYSAIAVGEVVQARARVVANYERRGHLMVDIDVGLVVGGGQLACVITHSAIYKPRPK